MSLVFGLSVVGAHCWYGSGDNVATLLAQLVDYQKNISKKNIPMAQETRQRLLGLFFFSFFSCFSWWLGRCQW